MREILVHSCYSPDFFEPRPIPCICKLWVSPEDAKLMLDRGEAIPVDTYTEETSIQKDGQIVLVGRRVRTPRVDGITQTAIERAFLDHNPDDLAYIEAWNELTIQYRLYTGRAPMLVPFKPDPFEGRALIIFWPDNRTHK